MENFNKEQIFMSSVYDILSKKDAIEVLKNHSDENCANINAFLVTNLFSDFKGDGINYCEGYMDGKPHSWCVSAEGVYFDPTIETNSDIHNHSYELMREYSWGEIDTIYHFEDRYFITINEPEFDPYKYID